MCDATNADGCRSSKATGGSAQEAELRERLKELDCLYHIADLCVKRKKELRDTLRRMLPGIAAGWQYPEQASVRIEAADLEVQTAGFRRKGRGLKQAILVDGKRTGTLEVRYPDAVAAESEGPVFLDGEVKLIEALAALIGNMVSQYRADEELRERAQKLERQKRELEEKNIALREILRQLDVDRKELESRIAADIENVVLPHILKLKNRSIAPDVYLKYVDTLYDNLKDVTSAFGLGTAGLLLRLSPREIEIVNLVRSGWTNKEMSDLLCIALSTVERHRHNIRKKLGIAGTGTNLATHLMGLEEADRTL